MILPGTHYDMLIQRVFNRHVDSVFGLASQFVSDRDIAVELVPEAFTQVLRSLRSGRGPNSHVRNYLLVDMRRVAYGFTRQLSALMKFGCDTMSRCASGYTE